MKAKLEYTLAEIAEKIGADIQGDPSCKINGVAPIQTAGPGDLTFIANKNYYKHLADTTASAVVLSPDSPECPIPSLRHANPYLKFSETIDLLYPDSDDQPVGVDKSSVVEESVSLDPTCLVGPLCHIKKGTAIGKSTKLISSVFVGKDVTIGDNCLIYPGVRILDSCKIGNNVIIHASTVVGSDGFGYAESPTGLKKIKQLGWVEIEDNVEIGSNCSIDRGALEATRIGAGTKIDNLVQIAHNVEIGQHCIIISQVGIAGSTKLGNQVVLAGQVGVVGHISIGDGAQVGAQSGVKKDLEGGKKYFGSPAREFLTGARIEAAQAKLPDLLKQISQFKKKLSE
ncbi:MAG: UDP-3-O-(3-hydroxymyristoyl)glucosamine N-acyltransferase [bacterium]|nr:UDP-3-O-(3-hydroxymyristoyl)glucosamine N-acyltransferase [bacterium]